MISMAERLGLSEVIASLRAELTDAMAEGTGKQVRFKAGTVDLEFNVTVAREGGVGGKVRFWVIEAGADGKVSSASTQTVKLRLEPWDTVAGGPVLTTDDTP